MLLKVNPTPQFCALCPKKAEDTWGRVGTVLHQSTADALADPGSHARPLPAPDGRGAQPPGSIYAAYTAAARWARAAPGRGQPPQDLEMGHTVPPCPPRLELTAHPSPVPGTVTTSSRDSKAPRPSQVPQQTGAPAGPPASRPLTPVRGCLRQGLPAVVLQFSRRNDSV